MNSASRNIDTLIKEASRMHPSTRWLMYSELAADYGEGFAQVVKSRVEETEKRRARRTPRAQRQRRAHDGGN